MRPSPTAFWTTLTAHQHGQQASALHNNGAEVSTTIEHEGEYIHGQYQQRHRHPGPKRQHPVYSDGVCDGVCHARRLRLSGSGYRAPQEPGQCPGQDHDRLRVFRRGLLLCRLLGCLWGHLLSGRRNPVCGARLRVGEVLLSDDLCRRHSRHRLRRHRRAGQVLAHSVCLFIVGGLRLPVFRRHRLERQLRPASLAGKHLRRRLS